MPMPRVLKAYGTGKDFPSCSLPRFKEPVAATMPTASTMMGDMRTDLPIESVLTSALLTGLRWGMMPGPWSAAGIS